MTAAELIADIQRDIDEAEARIEAFNERYAIQHEHIDESADATTQRAIDALQRPERFKGEHAVAKGWLRSRAPHTGIFRKSG